MSLKKKTHWFRKYTRRHNKHVSLSLQGCDGCLLIAVIVESVIAAEGREGTEPDSVGEKDLSTSIDPDLRERERVMTVRQTDPALKWLLSSKWLQVLWRETYKSSLKVWTFLETLNWNSFKVLCLRPIIRERTLNKLRQNEADWITLTFINLDKSTWFYPKKGGWCSTQSWKRTKGLTCASPSLDQLGLT